jgi:CRISPR-associated endonuclease/helicase Cas3
LNNSGKNRFDAFFSAAFNTPSTPYPYQSRIAISDWPEIINIPTGMGKTAAVIISWLYKRAWGDPLTPRRLVYCLPMRVLVEQTASTARLWIDNLIEAGQLPPAYRPSIHVLMGGDIDGSWDFYPERPSIIIGTQDQLLSRALNRGYSMSRFRWPVHFGLLNNDCLWVMDEVQLMGNGLATTTQLQAFRDRLGTILPTQSVWMSATLNRNWLNSIDFEPYSKGLISLDLGGDDLQLQSVNQRFNAPKPLSKASIDPKNVKQIAHLALESHRKGSRTLVILNTVKRATGVYKALKRIKGAPMLNLLHSRFRPPEKKQAIDRFLKKPGDDGTICVATQVVEAGIDVSSDTLITDLAPWSSLIQRFGRCNRDGRSKDAAVFWIPIDTSKKAQCLPYAPEELDHAACLLSDMQDACIASLPPVDILPDPVHVLRKRDLIELFDTTPDLAGADIDVSRYIRESLNHDVQVFWRDVEPEGPAQSEPAPTRGEFCPVPINLFSSSKLTAWRWDHLEGAWVRPNRGHLMPGMTLLLPLKGGGYSADVGWTGSVGDVPTAIVPKSKPTEGINDDQLSQASWQTIEEHTEMVLQQLKALLEGFFPEGHPVADDLMKAALWHDYGKAHPVFQGAVAKDGASLEPGSFWAKSPTPSARYERKGFRHELVSALAMIQHDLPDLSVYLAAAHHGKIRLSIRSMPHEIKPDEPNKNYAMGIWAGDQIPMVSLNGELQVDPIELDLSVMEIGKGPLGPSWVTRTTKLRDDPALGPFRLAFLEAIFRVTDWRASMEGKKNG